MAVFNEVPTQQELWKMFNYHSDGYLIWRIRPAKNINIGDRAGVVRKNGYTQISVNGVNYYAHRLIYQFFNGNLDSKTLVDHRDNNPKNNLIKNLREITRNGNGRNRGVQANSKLGIKGVSWNKQHKKYLATIKVSGKIEHLGYFVNKFDAYEAYRKRCLEVDSESYADNSQDMRPEVFIEYQEYMLQKQTNIFKLAA